MRISRATPLLLPTLLCFAFGGCGSTSGAPEPAPPRPAADPVSSVSVEHAHWQSTVTAQAERLRRDWPTATVRVLVVDVASGAVIAREGPVQEAHPTGSSIKGLLVAAAFEAGVEADQVIDGSAVELRGRTLVDHHPVPSMTVAEALARSSSVAMVRLARRVGPGVLAERLETWTAGSFEGADDDETIGALFGGTTRLSSLGLARGYALLARGGLDVDGTHRMEASAASAALAALEAPVTHPDGTARRAAVDGIRVGGKTGTARDETGNTAAFVGVAPLVQPRWVVTVVVEGVDDQAYGGNVAAPAFARIVKAATQRMPV